MSVTLTVRDETASGEVYHEVPLEFPSERISIRDLIRERAYQEVQDFNRKQGERVFRGLVQPTDTERILNDRRIEYRLASTGSSSGSRSSRRLSTLSRQRVLHLDRRQAG